MQNLPELVAAILVPTLFFLILPWMIFHYITKWKSNATLTREDENLLDELHDLARRLDDRMCSIERIMSAENPNWRSVACDPAEIGIPDAGLSNQPSRRIGR